MDHARQNLEAAQVLRVLMLEDRDDDALLVEHALRKTGFAYALQRAYGKTDFAEHLNPDLDLILADFHVPGFGGLQALETLKKKRFDVPLIVVSGAITEAEAAEAVRRGAADYVLKDRLGRLGAAITAALEQKALRSEMHEALAALAKTENEFRSAFEHAATGMAFTTLDGRWLRVNPALCEIIGYAEDELLRTHCHTVTHAEDIAEDETLLRQLVAGEILSSRRDKRYVHKRGHTVWVNVTASLVRDPDGTPLYRVLQVIDITRRIRADERFRSTFEQAAVGIAHTTTDGRFLVVNDKLCEMLGYSRDELMRATTLEFSHPATRGQYAALYEEVAEGRRPRFSGEKQWVRKDGSVIWVNRTVSRADSAIEREPYLIQVIEDITERKRTEESLERANRARLVLAECNHAQTRATDESELLEDMCRAAVELGRYKQAWVGLATGDSLRPVYAAAHAGYGGDAPMTAPATWTADGRYHGLAGEAIAHGETRIARDILNDPRHAAKRERALQLEYQSSIALPIRGEGQILAVLVLHATERDAFDNDEILLLTELADDIGFGITTLRTRDARRKAEAALRESEERFRVLTELSSDWSWEQDADFRFTEVSMTVKSQAGISAEDHVGRTRWELPRTDPVNTTWDEHEAMLRAHRPFHDLILRRTGEDGSIDYVSVSGRPMFDAKGAFKGYRGVAKNITDKIRADTALRESERRFREMFEQAAVGITRVDLGGFLVDFNQKFCEMLGYEREELLGRHLREITHPDDYGQGSQYRAQVTDGTAKSRTGEKRFVRKDGTILWARRTMSGAYDGSGNIQYVISVVEDITERKELERRFEMTFDHAAVGMTQVGLDGRFLHVNQKYLDMLGYGRDELRGMTTEDVTHPDDRLETMQLRHKLLNGEIGSISGEKRLVRKDGRIVWVGRTSSLARGISGEPLYLITVVEDITERKQLEHQFQDTFEQAAVGIMYSGMDRRILHVNRKLCELLGYLEEELLARTTTDLIHPDHRNAHDEQYRQLVEGKVQSFVSERPFVRKDGSTIWLRRTASLVRDSSGKPWYFVRTLEDISERRVSDQRRSMEHAVTRVLAESETLEEAMPVILRTLCENHGWACGSHWQWDGNAEMLRCAHSWHVQAEEVAEFIAFTRTTVNEAPAWHGEAPRTQSGGLVRRVWASGAPVWFPDVTQQPDFRRGPVAAKAGLHCAFGFPILAGVQALGVMEFYSREIKEPDDALLQIVRSIGRQIGQFIQRKRAEEALRENEAQLRAMFDQAAVGITMSTLDLGYVQVNDKFCDIVGYSREELLRMSVRDVNLPENMDDAVGYRRKLFSGEIQSTVREKPLRRKDGSAVWVSLVTSVIRDNTGNPKHFISVVQDISQRKRAEAALMESEEQFRQLAGNIPQVFWIGDVAQKKTVYVSPASERMLGLRPEELSGNPRKLVRAVHPDDRARVYRARRSAISGQYDETYRVVRPDGSIRWVHDRAFPVRDASGSIYRIAGIAEDITERKEAEEQLLQLAHYDVLTSLPNRVLFYDRLKQALAQAKRNQWITGVMFIDLDRFKNVNDTLGHVTGDKLLQQVSGRLTRAVRTGDTVGRLGGDEFAVVLSNLSSTQDASLVAQKIMAAFNEPFQLDGSEIYITVSIGITLYPNDSTDQDTLIKNADAAMYRAKDVGRNSYQFYTPEMNARSLEMLSLESSLRRALDRNEFLFYYQPKASIASGEITGLEALLRWRHPVRGLVSPADFIPLMEETGLIVQAGSWILNTVCSQIAEWQRAGIKPVPIAVNLSARQFLARDLGPGIKRVLEEYQIDPALIELEITESSLMVNTEEAARTLEYLKSLGVGLAIDDFGTGYSSFGYLKRFPLDALKLDRSFVRDITTDADDATITRAVISMAHSLGLTIVAEGVETEAQLAFLAEYGCDQVQGYYFARPMGAEECSTWLREQRRLQRPRTGDDSNAPLVLLVDDDEDALTLIKRALAKDGNRVLTARNAHEALEMLGQHQVDVVISDQSMPGIPGVEFLQRVKALSPRTVRMMTSGYSDFRFLTEAVNKSEIFRFLPKSLTEEELRADVREALRARAEAHDAHYAIPGTTGK